MSTESSGSGTVPVSGFGELTPEQIRELSKPAEPGPMQLFEKNQELNAENRALREQNIALQHELTQEQNRRQILEQRLRRIGDAVVDGRIVDGQ